MIMLLICSPTVRLSVGNKIQRYNIAQLVAHLEFAPCVEFLQLHLRASERDVPALALLRFSQFIERLNISEEIFNIIGTLICEVIATFSFVNEFLD